MLFTEPDYLATRLPRYLFDFAAVFARSGYQTLLVGGAVRDLVLGKTPGDFDFCTDAQPDTVQGLFRAVIPTGIEHGTVTVRFYGHSIEVTTFRIDGSYLDSRRPDSVTFTDDLRADVSRRDFSINALALSLPECMIIDYIGGLDDLAAGRIRAIGDPVDRFSEDSLRVLRGLRFAAILGFRIDEATLQAMHDTAAGIHNVAAERIRVEWIKLLSGGFLVQALPLLPQTGLLGLFSPFSAPRTKAKNDTCCVSLEILAGNLGRLLSPEDWEWRFAAFILHSRQTRELAFFPAQDNGNSTDVLTTFLHTRRYTKKETNRIIARVSALGIALPQCDRVAVRRYLFSIQPCDWQNVSRAREALGYSVPDVGLAAMLRQEQQRGIIRGVHDICISGQDLQGELEREPGPWIGETLRYLAAQVVDNPDKNTRADLLHMAADYNS